MNQIPIWVLFIISFSLLLHSINSDEDDVKRALITFVEKLSNNNSMPGPVQGWNLTSDPCQDQWDGIVCENRSQTIKKIFLDGLNFSGTFDASALCNDQSLSVSLVVISLNFNNIDGENLDQIENCKQLTRFHISGNRFSGSLPNSFSRLNNLKRLDLSNNKFSGEIPDLTRISGLTEFLAQNNQLNGVIPNFDFSNFVLFNVSFNNFSGSIPGGAKGFPVSSFIGNPDLCGDPLPNGCQSLPSESGTKNSKKGVSGYQILMFSGYFLIGLVIVIFIIFRVCKKGKTKEDKFEKGPNKVASIDDSFKPSFVSVEYKPDMDKSENLDISTGDQSACVSQSLIVLTSPEVNGLRFEDLLKAPAELLGRGKNGSVYKVICNDGMTLAVKRIKDWSISSSDFKQRMRRLDEVKHPNVLQAMAFYCSMQEKLLVYEYQPNGSLFRLLHGTQMGLTFEWSSRLGIAATIAETLAFMHQELSEDKIAHGNLKSTNILLTKTMEPCISEYGLIKAQQSGDDEEDDQDSCFKADIYGLGVILLELLTGKLVQTNNGMDLARWVLSVVREEWTGEVFDRSLIREGASEERLVNLLQIAVKCVDGSTKARPSVNKVAVMINAIKDEEERSIVSEA